MQPNLELLSVVGAARPLRVAYLVDLDKCPDALLNAIFAEGYGRWGGRRTLIVPTTTDGIDPRYSDWLAYFDADIIYSFVALGDGVVENIHERYAPAFLTSHWPLQATGEPPRYTIRLPISALTSLSVLPTWLANIRLDFTIRDRSLQLLEHYPDRSESAFLTENFGFPSSTFNNAQISSLYPELFSCLTLISADTLADPRMGKDKKAEFVTSEADVMDALGSHSRMVVTLSQLSDWCSEYLDPGCGNGPTQQTCIVVGDTPADRMTFWNLHHLFEGSSGTLKVLRLPVAALADEAFLERVKQLVRHRGLWDNGNNAVGLLSCSRSSNELEQLAANLRSGNNWLRPSPTILSDHASIVPRFDHANAHIRFGFAMADRRSEATSEFFGTQAILPAVQPWHMKQVMPPPGFLRAGRWMVDYDIERHNNHSRHSNQRHVWRFPRRLRLERAFVIDSQGGNYFSGVTRVTRTAQLGMAVDIDTAKTAVAVPEDVAALRIGICNDLEWRPFDRTRPHSRSRFAEAELSDKGRYLLGILQLFESLPDACSVLMDSYWRDVLIFLGASTHAAKDNNRRRERRFIGYYQLLKRWCGLLRDFEEKQQGRKNQQSDFFRNRRYLDRSIEYLCQCEVLFQGREWRCDSCYNRNWVGIDNLTRSWTCAVCGQQKPAEVSGQWQFQLNPFVLEAYRDHGSEAVIWALWQLAERAKKSFYFSPSLGLRKSHRMGQTFDAEIDAVCVVDGLVYLVEAKSSARSAKKNGLDGLILAAERIRPDVIVLACMNDPKSRLAGRIQQLQEALPADIAIERLDFVPSVLHRSPILPC